MTNAKPSGLLPKEFNVVVEMDPVEQVTKGGIILTATQTDRDKHAAEVGTLTDVSPLAFTYADWPEGEQQPQVGDRVLVARYTGVMHTIGDRTFRVLKDKEIVAVIEPGVKLAAIAA